MRERWVGDLRQAEEPHVEYLRAQLDCLPYSTALLERDGSIVAVNGEWRRFARDNGADAVTARGVGLNYLEACRAFKGADALSVHDGISQVLSGNRGSFETIYSCHSPTQMRWFRISARKFEESDTLGDIAAVAHLDVTDYFMANARFRIQATVARAIACHARLLDACRELALAVCHEQEWDYAGIWTVDTPSWTLRCCETWSRPELQLSWFERATRAAALSPGSGLPGRAWLTGKVQWATDLQLEDGAPVRPHGRGRIMPPSALEAGFRSALSFPLKWGDDVFAVVDVFSRVRRPPDSALMELLEASGDQLALCELRERAEAHAREAQRQADDARARLESVLECAPALVLVIDRENKIQFINRTLPQHRKEDVLGVSWKHYVVPADHPRVEAALASVFRTGKAQSYEAAHADAAGQQRWFLNRMAPIRGAGNIVGAVVIAQEITDAKLAQAELADAQRLAAVGTLAAGVAHEINTPVQFVNDSIHFLREAVTDTFALLEALGGVKRAVEHGAPQEELARMVEAASDAEEQADLPYLVENVPRAFERSIEGLERVTTIVRSMKEFAHPSQKEMAPADLNRAIMATLTVARNEYKYVAEAETQLGDLPLVTCHLNDINQVVLNMVVNAAHAIEDVVRGTDHKGLIKVSTRCDGNDAVIEISDTGAGIPEAARGRIFDPFFTTKEVGKGTGQGLAMARATIREKHGGELTFQTTLGQGTTFFIRLPVEGKKQSPRGAA